jgi:hypothetical protein
LSPKLTKYMYNNDIFDVMFANLVSLCIIFSWCWYFFSWSIMLRNLMTSLTLAAGVKHDRRGVSWTQSNSQNKSSLLLCGYHASTMELGQFLLNFSMVAGMLNPGNPISGLQPQVVQLIKFWSRFVKFDEVKDWASRFM